jgi:hypothetical protein
VLETNNQEQLIFKHAISTVVTVRSVHHAAAPAAVPAVAVSVAGAGSASEG